MEKEMITSVKTLCYKSKTLANGEHPIMLRVTKDRKVKYVSLGVSVKPEQWNFEEERPKRNCLNREAIEKIISDIDVDFLKKFERWMRNKGLKENTMGIYCRNIRTLYNIAIRKKYVKKDLYPFDEFKCAKLKNKTVKRSLTKMDMKKIIEYGKNYQPNKEYYNGAKFEKDYTKFAIDIFSFIYYMAGINFTDVARLMKNAKKDPPTRYRRPARLYEPDTP